MAVEPRRGCGYRKVGGLYLVGPALNAPCDRLPFALTVCRTCGAGYAPARGWPWVEPAGLFDGIHLVEDLPLDEGEANYKSCKCPDCSICHAPENLGRSGLLWVGQGFYATPQDFLNEAASLGISRRISHVPKDFVAGQTWVLLAHPKACNTVTSCDTVAGPGTTLVQNRPGIFAVFRPTAVEKIITDKEAQDPEVLAALEKRGIRPVVVPAGDPDHQGSVYDEAPSLDLETKETHENSNG